MNKADLLIGGVERPAASGKTFVRHSVMTGQAATEAAAAGVEDALAAADAAAAAFEEWSQVGPGEKRGLLLRAAHLLEENLPEFERLFQEELDSPPSWARRNVMLATDILLEAASLTTQITGDIVPVNAPGRTSFAVRRPVGTVLAIAPWNGPVVLGVRSVAVPLACGNTVILKSSEHCPGSHALIGRILTEAGLKPGVVNVISHSPEDAPQVVEALIGHPAVRRINFTGSTKVGRIIAETAARHLKPVLLELGGKSPTIVLEDADLDAAARAVLVSAYTNRGQICMSTERVIIDEKVADAFCEKLRALCAERADDPAFCGPLCTADAGARFSELIDDALEKGGQLLTKRLDASRLSFSPMVIDQVTRDMRLYKEEIFGPLVAVLRVRGIDRAIEIANDIEYGLTAAVFGTDLRRALEVARRVNSGMCHINKETVYNEIHMPFGGVKHSGYGRFGGRYEIGEFTELRWLTMDTAI